MLTEFLVVCATAMFRSRYEVLKDVCYVKLFCSPSLIDKPVIFCSIHFKGICFLLNTYVWLFELLATTIKKSWTITKAILFVGYQILLKCPCFCPWVESEIESKCVLCNSCCMRSLIYPMDLMADNSLSESDLEHLLCQFAIVHVCFFFKNP